MQLMRWIAQGIGEIKHLVVSALGEAGYAYEALNVGA